MASENLIDKIKLYQKKIRQTGIAQVDIEEEKSKQTGTVRALIRTGDQETFASNSFNIKTDIIITLSGIKKNASEVTKRMNQVQELLHNDMAYQDTFGGITRIDNDSNMILELTVSTDYRHI